MGEECRIHGEKRNIFNIWLAYLGLHPSEFFIM
jgi:hypothetical protein